MPNTKNKIFLIFSGANHRAIIAFCRELVSLKKKFFIIARTRTDLILQTRYRKNVVAIRSRDDIDIDDFETCIKQAADRAGGEEFVVCPTSEYLNQLFLSHESLFKKYRCTIPLVSAEKYEQVTSKYSFAALCKQNGIRVPDEYSDIDNVIFPFVAKPIKNINAENRSLYPYLIFTSEDLTEFKHAENQKDYFFQQYIKGSSYYLLFYIAKDGRVWRFSQHNLIQQADGKSIVMAKAARVHQLPIADEFLNVLKDIGFYGLAMIEVIQQGEVFYCIELNPRFWGPSQLMVDAGTNIFKAFVFDALGEQTGSLCAETGTSNVCYLWFNGIVENLLKQKKIVWHVDPPKFKAWFVLKNLFRDVYFRPDTLRLFFYELFGMIKA